MNRTEPGVVVVGAGVIGCACAYHLACRGLHVDLLDPATAPSGATRASLGVLTHSNGGENPLSRLYRQGLASFPLLSAVLRQETGIDIGWQQPGGLDLVCSDADEAEGREALAFNQERGCVAEWVEGTALNRLEPALPATVRAAVHYPGDQRVDPVRLRQALLQAAVQRGASLHLGEALESFVECTDLGVTVQTSRGRLHGAAVVLAAGAWTAALAALVGARVPVRPVRGQRARFGGGPAIARVLRHGGYHLVPEGDHVIAGATVEEVGFDEQVTPEAAAAFAAAREQMLGVAGSPVEQGAGLRPKPKGARPLIGPLIGSPRVFVATGHYKNGILMASATGDLVAGWIAEGGPAWDLGYFAPER